MSWLKRTVHRLDHAGGEVRRTVDRAGGSALRAASRVPGASSALVAVTGGAAALNPAIRRSASREFAMGAAAGGGILAARVLSSRQTPTSRDTPTNALPDAVPHSRSDGFNAMTGGSSGGPLDSPSPVEDAELAADAPAGGAKPKAAAGGALVVGGVVLAALVVLALVFAPRRR
jgi:hypothetical protein